MLELALHHYLDDAINNNKVFESFVATVKDGWSKL